MYLLFAFACYQYVSACTCRLSQNLGRHGRREAWKQWLGGSRPPRYRFGKFAVREVERRAAADSRRWCVLRRTRRQTAFDVSKQNADTCAAAERRLPHDLDRGQLLVGLQSAAKQPTPVRESGSISSIRRRDQLPPRGGRCRWGASGGRGDGQFSRSGSPDDTDRPSAWHKSTAQEYRWPGPTVGVGVPKSRIRAHTHMHGMYLSTQISALCVG